LSAHDVESAGATPYWHDVPMLTHTRANVISKQSVFPVSHQQFNDRIRASLVPDGAAKHTMAMSSEKLESQLNAGTSPAQPTNAAEASAVTQNLSTGQKKRVGVFYVLL